ncbi:WD40 repeat domain-containing protein [Asanoa iriomotensis]|uniref:WD40 repeat protein n=1 Tax=Asanoa iriomotensis TaxID=234613 RepID=A0ABQ4C3D8_9ACTN|nr:hypothetical protein [Asanoa iriomotensis]GIF57279.1 hypothetical protein Air01nite_33740 [Asanoa iriomotensis]
MSAELRRALRELTDVPPPPHLAAKAIQLAERRRRRRIVAGAAAVVVVVAVAVAVPLALRPGGDSEPVPIGPTPSVTSPTPGALPETPQVVAAAYARATPNSAGSGPDDRRSYVLDPAIGQYRELPYRVVVPSPDGKRFFVADTRRGGIMDGARGSVRWVSGYDTYVNGVEWSPDGRRVLISSLGKDEPGGFMVVDAATAKAGRLVPMADMQTLNSRGLGFFWMPDGRTIGHTLTSGAGESIPDRTVGVRFYDLDGRTLRTLGLTGNAAVRTSADVSPDGRRAVAVLDWGDEHQARIVDLTTGEVTAEFDAKGVAGWYDDDHLVLRGNEALEVVDLTGRVVRSMPGSADLLDGATVHLVRADGLPAKSARYAF